MLYFVNSGNKIEKVKLRNHLRSSSRKTSASNPKSSDKSSDRKCFAEKDKVAIENQENCVNGISNKCDDVSKITSKSTEGTILVNGSST